MPELRPARGPTDRAGVARHRRRLPGVRFRGRAEAQGGPVLNPNDYAITRHYNDLVVTGRLRPLSSSEADMLEILTPIVESIRTRESQEAGAAS